MVSYERVNFATLKPEHITEDTLIVSTARGQYPWLNTEVASVIVEELCLAPSEELFNDFQESKDQFIDEGFSRGVAHAKAWIAVNYEERFLEDLETRDLPDFNDYAHVIFSCWCAKNSPCHTDLLVDYYTEDDVSQITLLDFEEVEEIEIDYKPISIANELLKAERGTSWNFNRGRNSVEADPLNGKAVPGYIHYPKGHCQECGKKIYRSKNKKRVAKYCVECAPKVEKRQHDVRNFRRTIVRRTVGFVPVEPMLFSNYVRYFNYGLSKKERLHMQVKDYSEMVVSETRTLPKGEEPERAGKVVCPDCGGHPVIYNRHVDETNVTGLRCQKIGGKILVCRECGLVLSNSGLKSFAPSANSGYLGD